MFRKSVTVENGADGKPLAVPESFRKGVERASLLLDAELPSDVFEISADWRFFQGEKDRIEVVLDLTSPYEKRKVGYTGYPFDSDSFSDDATIRRVLRTPIWNFTRTLSHLNKMETKHLRKDLEQLVTAGGD